MAAIKSFHLTKLITNHNLSATLAKTLTTLSMSQAWLTKKVVPDVIDEVPPNKLGVQYPEITVNEGNVLRPRQAKSPPAISWGVQDESSLFAICMTDPDAPSRSKPTQREWQHWLVVNIPGNKIEKAITMSSRVKLMMKLVTKEINKENFNSDEFPKVAKSDIDKANFDDTEHQCNDKNELGKCEPNKINENLLFDSDDNDDEYKDPDFDPNLSDNTESEGEMNIYKGKRHIKIKDVNEKQEKGEKHNRKSYPQDNIESEEDTVIGKSKKGMKRKAPYDVNNEAEHKDVEI